MNFTEWLKGIGHRTQVNLDDEEWELLIKCLIKEVKKKPSLAEKGTKIIKKVNAAMIVAMM